MPLITGYSRKSIAANIRKLMHERYPQPQAVRIALQKARQAWAQAHRGASLPHHLRFGVNPVGIEPLTQQAKELYESFMLQPATASRRVTKPHIPGVLVHVGRVVGIAYEAARDGKQKKYYHEFRSSSRPLLTVSPDGKKVFLLGGAFTFTDRGFVDR